MSERSERISVTARSSSLVHRPAARSDSHVVAVHR
jgi:hypothetical protein